MSTDRYKIADVSQLTENGTRIVTEVNGKEIGVFRLDNEFYAMANFCPHQLGPLCEGEPTGYMAVEDDGIGWQFVDDGSVVACPWHGWKFDVTSGESVQTSSYVVPTYEVEIDDEEIFVRLP